MAELDARAVVTVRARRRPALRVPSARTVAAATLLAIVALCVLAPLTQRFDPNELDPANAFAGASLEHFFGTDDLGRDLWSRVLNGGRISLVVCGGAVAIAFLLGTTWGFVAASRRGLVDEALMRTADALMSIPQLLFGLVCISAFGASVLNLTLIIGVLLAPSTARLARAAALSEMTRDYYAAAIAYGATSRQLLIRELLPNAAPTLGVQAAINAASAIIIEASLSFVGLGVQSPDASWGTLLQQGYAFLSQNAGYAVFPGIAILLTISMLNVLAEQLGQRRTGGRS